MRNQWFSPAKLGSQIVLVTTFQPQRLETWFVDENSLESYLELDYESQIFISGLCDQKQCHFGGFA